MKSEFPDRQPPPCAAQPSSSPTHFKSLRTTELIAQGFGCSIYSRPAKLLHPTTAALTVTECVQARQRAFSLQDLSSSLSHLSM